MAARRILIPVSIAAMRPRCVWAKRAALSHGNQYGIVIKQKGAGRREEEEEEEGEKHNNPLWKVGYVEKCRAVQTVDLPAVEPAI